MRRLVRVASIAVAVLFVGLAAILAWKWEEVQRLLAVNTLFDEERIVANFSDMSQLFPTVAVDRGELPVSPLPAGTALDLPEEALEWVKARDVTALVVLHDGRIVHDEYYLGTGAEDLRIAWSVSKSFLSALLGVLLEEGAIASLDDQVTKHAPELQGSAYDGATVRDALNMASGVAFDEDVTDFDSDLNRMGRVLALGRSMDDFAAGLTERAGPPGETWRYVSIDTHVLAMVIRGATGRSIPDLMSEKIIAPLGFEAEPRYVTDGHGVAFALGGLNLTTRDAARFGQMFLRGGALGGRRIVPKAWVEASTVPSPPDPPTQPLYGYQWWIPRDATEGEFLAEGIYGQYIYVNRPLDVVIAANSADRDFRGKTEGNIEVLRAIAAAAAERGRVTSNRCRRFRRRRERRRRRLPSDGATVAA